MSRSTDREGVNVRSVPRVTPDPPEVGPSAAPFWLSSAKVTVPDRVVGYVHRPSLLERVAPTGHRVTVLKAPAGFGKTVLMAESCRDLRKAGTVAAWLTLDGDDAPQTLDTYVAFAFERAGLNVGGPLDAAATEGTGVRGSNTGWGCSVWPSNGMKHLACWSSTSWSDSTTADLWTC